MKVWFFDHHDMKVWFFDHLAHWAEQVGELMARPWMKLSRWSFNHWARLRLQEIERAR